MKTIAALCLFAIVASLVLADVPSHCEFPQIRGLWQFQLTKDGNSKEIAYKCNYTAPIEPASSLLIFLDRPNVAADVEKGIEGTWTLTQDSGFEIRVDNKVYFAFFNYTQQGDKYVTDCSRTMTGLYHEIAINPQNWGCLKGQKVGLPTGKFAEVSPITVRDIPQETCSNKLFTNDKKLIEKINAEQKSWVAAAYPQWEGMRLDDMLRMAGGKRESPAPKREKVLRMNRRNDLPENWDWRNVDGVNYVSPVRDQMKCGSCYAFASAGSIESRIRVATKNQEQPVISPQDIVNCNPYSQGCHGGDAFLVGKYGMDFGVLPESCTPYNGSDASCDFKKCQDQRYYVADYNYVGGYYGATDEISMMEAIYSEGPIAIGFLVYRDFMYYKGGIYHHNATFLAAAQDKPDPHYEATSHAVVIIGWGVEPTTGEKFWIAKNSWSENWGENGFFRIRRGTDESNVESKGIEIHIVKK